MFVIFVRKEIHSFIHSEQFSVKYTNWMSRLVKEENKRNTDHAEDFFFF